MHRRATHTRSRPDSHVLTCFHSTHEAHWPQECAKIALCVDRICGTFWPPHSSPHLHLFHSIQMNIIRVYAACALLYGRTVFYGHHSYDSILFLALFFRVLFYSFLNLNLLLCCGAVPL